MINDILKLVNWKNVTFQFSILLVVVLCLSFFDLIWFANDNAERIRDFVNVIVLFAISEGFYVLNYYFFKIKNVNYLHLGITASIIFLVVHPTTPWFMYIVVMVMALLGKFLIRGKSGPIFNPAALGIALGYVVSVVLVKIGLLQETLFESWWGSDLQFTFYRYLPVLWVLSAGLLFGFLYYAKRFNKLNHGFAYYLTYMIISFLYLQVKGMPISSNTYLLNLFTGSFIFLSFVMVTEPKTSPIMKNQQIWLGITGGIILFIFSNIIPDYLPFLNIEIPVVSALLVLNLITYMVKTRAMLPPVPVGAKPAVPIAPANQPQTKVV